jgi:hypothetical protein
VDSVSATATVEAPVDVVFEVLADPTTHPTIDGTGWVCEALDSAPLTAAGQVFRMAMYHPDHPDGDYLIFNEVQVLDRPRAVAWKPGYDAEDGTLGFGGWVWRYDLTPLGPASTEVVLTYDWSAVEEPVRRRIGFPPCPPEHLRTSLAHLGELAAVRVGGTPGPAR